MIPSPNSPILLRKVGGAFDAIRRTRAGASRLIGAAHAGVPSLLGISLSFVAVLLVPLLLLGLTLLALHAPHGHGVALAMAAPIVELRQKRATLAAEANTALEAARTKAKTEARALTAEELQAQDDFDTRLTALDQDIKLEERKLDRERMYGSAGTPDRQVPGSGPQRTPSATVRERAEDDPRRGFRSHRDFLLSVMAAAGIRSRADVSDERLRPLAIADKEDKESGGELAFLLPAGFAPRAAAGSDEQGGYDDRYGGFAVGRSRAAGLLEVGFEGDPTVGLTQDLPMATPVVDIMARTDKDHTTSVSGGFTVTRRPETVAGSGTRTQLEMVTMKAASLFGLAYATEEILVDSPISFAAIIDSGFRTQFGAHLLNEKLRGKGGNEYLGVLNSPALITQVAEGGQVAGTIVALNVINMASRCWGFGRAVWLANHDTKPQLMQLQIATGNTAVLIYQPSPQAGFPDTLLGRPIFYTEFASTLGQVGDLILSNWSQFLEGTYQPIQSAESVHVRFVNHERTFKFWLRNAGAPWWRAPLTPNKSAKTLSPFVTLAAR